MPSGETNAVNVSPVRTSRTQYGAARPVLPVTPEAELPVPLRCCSAVPFAGDMKLMTYCDDGIERFADHHAGLGPAGGVLHVQHARRDGAIAGQGLKPITEFVAGIPDVRAGTLNGEHAVGQTERTGRADRADILRQPVARRRAGQRRGGFAMNSPIHRPRPRRTTT